MSDEYSSLREELLQWQSRRFVIVSSSVAFVIAILTLNPVIVRSMPWHCVSIMLLLFLLVASYLTAYCGIANQRIGSYIQVFYKSSSYGWESRNSKFGKVFKEISNKYVSNLNKVLSSIYLALGAISCVIPPLLSSSDENALIALLLVIFVAICYLVAIIHLYKSQGNREYYLLSWQDIKSKEQIVATQYSQEVQFDKDNEENRIDENNT